jgi:hypothetical protein
MRVRPSGATMLTGTEWRNLKIPQAEFDRLQPTEYADLTVFGLP